MRQRKHRFPQNKLKFISGVNLFKIFSIVLIVLYIYLSPTFIKKMIRITKIEYCDQFNNCTTRSVSSKYFYAKKQVEEELKQDAKIKDYLIQYRIPSSLKIETVIKTPKYGLKDSLSNLLLISSDGIAIETSDETELPTLTNKNSSYKIGDKIADNDFFALKILERVNKINRIYGSEINNGSLEVKVDNGIQVIFPIEGDIDVLAGSLKLIFSRLNDETVGTKMVNVHQIDLRFNNPVIR